MAGGSADHRRSSTTAYGSILHSPPQAPAGATRLTIARQPPGGELRLRHPARPSSGTGRFSRPAWHHSPASPCCRPQDQHQRRHEGQLAIDRRGHRLAGGMAVGRTQHLPAVLPAPALGQQLFARINREPLSALAQRFPAVATGPDPSDPPAGAIDQAQQQPTALLGQGTAQISPQNRQRQPTDSELRWQVRVHSGKLPAVPYASTSLHE